MEFRVLSRLELRSDEGAPITVSQPLIRAAICVLALKTDQPLASEQLRDLLWEPGVADRRAGAIKTCVSGVRRVLTHERLPHGHAGYRLRLLPGDTVDVLRFRDLASRAREAGGRGDSALAADLYERALALWRTPPLPDLPATAGMSGLAAALLAERRLAREELARHRLTLGRHHELVPEVRAWVAEEPLSERLWARLLLALYRAGAKAEALRTYDEVRDVLVQATGSEPAPELRLLRRRIGADDPGLLPGAASRTVPPGPLARQLPPDLRDFTGRDAERGRLRQLLSFAAEATAPPVAHITGPPGIGKTSLAVHVAHAVAGAFPDGQLYVPLAGASPSPRDPAAVLEEVLRAIGVAAGDVPGTLAGRAAMYRSRLAGLRVLVVADDVAGPGQAGPLLPGTPGCAVIITGRGGAPSSDGAHLVALDRLPHAEGVRLLGRIVGRDRVEADRDAADRVVRACGGHPLALRVAGARLAARPSWPLAWLADHRALWRERGGGRRSAGRAGRRFTRPARPARHPARRLWRSDLR